MAEYIEKFEHLIENVPEYSLVVWDGRNIFVKALDKILKRKPIWNIGIIVKNDIGNMVVRGIFDDHVLGLQPSGEGEVYVLPLLNKKADQEIRPYLRFGNEMHYTTFIRMLIEYYCCNTEICKGENRENIRELIDYLIKELDEYCANVFSYGVSGKHRFFAVT